MIAEYICIYFKIKFTKSINAEKKTFFNNLYCLIMKANKKKYFLKCKKKRN